MQPGYWRVFKALGAIMCTDGVERDLSRRVRELEQELGEARDQQRATTEILSVISRSPTDAQSVFDTITASATRLCDGLYSVVFRFDGEMITVAADSGESPRASAIIRSAYPAPPGRGTIGFPRAARASGDRRDRRPGQRRESSRCRARACHWLPSRPVGADAERRHGNRRYQRRIGASRSRSPTPRSSC